MDKEKVIKKIKQGAPVASAIVVAACIGVSLSGYQAPVYEAQAQTKETKTTDADEAKKTESKAKGSFDLADGIYKGTGTGYAGEVTVQSVHTNTPCHPKQPLPRFDLICTLHCFHFR